MGRLRRRLLLNAFLMVDLCVMAAAFALALLVSADTFSPGNPAWFLAVRVKVSNFLLFVGLLVTWHLIFRAQGLYQSRRIALLASEWWEVAKAVALGTLVLALVALLADLQAVDRTFLGVFFAAVLSATVLTRTLLRLGLGEVRRRGRNLRNVVIVGCGPRGARLGAEIWKRPELGYLLLGYIDDLPPPLSPLHGHSEKRLGGLGDAPRLLVSLEVDEILVCLPLRSHYEAISRIVAMATEMGLIVRMPADFFELKLAHAEVGYLAGVPIVTLSTAEPAPVGLFFKRIADIVGGAMGLIFLSPILVAIAIAIKGGSPGPVFFAQERVGLGRRKFRMWKFRTMVPDAEVQLAAVGHLNEVVGAAFKIHDDPRVTRVGRVLRRFSLDELPQLLNVVTGDMSLVGPRPLPIRDAEKLSEVWQQRRFSMKPGLTCLWQANGRHEITFDHWMELDLQYIDQWSPALDFQIVLKTLPAVLRGTGAS